MMHQVFPTLIYQAPLFSFERISKKKCAKHLKEMERECYIFADSDDAGHLWCEENCYLGYTSYGSLSRLDQYSSTFSELEEFLRPHVEVYIQKLNYDVSLADLELNSLWMNIMPQGCYHTSHIHPLSVVSGTLYLKVDQKSSAIKFEDPRLTNFMNQPLKKNNARQTSPYHVEIKPQIGDVVLFESWLRHEVPLHQGRSERISISFNYGWKGRGFEGKQNSSSSSQKNLRGKKRPQ